MGKWPDYHKPTAEQADAMAQWMVDHGVPQILRPVIRKKFCQLNWSPERVKNTTKTQLMEANPRYDHT